MKTFLVLLGGAALVGAGYWYWTYWNSPDQRRQRSIASDAVRTQTGGNSIFNEPNMEPIPPATVM